MNKYYEDHFFIKNLAKEFYFLKREKGVSFEKVKSFFDKAENEIKPSIGGNRARVAFLFRVFVNNMLKKDAVSFNHIHVEANEVYGFEFTLLLRVYDDLSEHQKRIIDAYKKTYAQASELVELSKKYKDAVVKVCPVSYADGDESEE